MIEQLAPQVLMWTGTVTIVLWLLDKATTCLVRIIVKLYYAFWLKKVYKSDVV